MAQWPEALKWVPLVNHEGGDPPSRQLRVASLNVLADSYSRSASHAHAPRAALAWPARSAALLQALDRLNADVLCLQEVGG